MPEFKVTESEMNRLRKEFEDTVNQRQPGLTGDAFNEAFKAEVNRALKRPCGIQQFMALEKLAR